MKEEIIVLTGAGFTKNFGGFLGEEMWSKIFNNPKISQNEELKNKFISQSVNRAIDTNFDYEWIYSEILENKNKLLEKSKQSFQESIEEAYQDLDMAIVDYIRDTSGIYKVNLRKICSELILEIINNNKSKKLLFFTLNQDLLMERYANYQQISLSHIDITKVNGLEKKYYKILPKDDINMEEAIKNNGGLAYIKLHGSYGWFSADGSKRMVVGLNKMKVINNEPLLKSYFEFFEKTLNDGNKRILIIGYGFRDDHINKLLANGIGKNNRLYIIDTKKPSEFRKELNNLPESDIFNGQDKLNIWHSVYGYFPYSLKEIFPADSTTFSQLREIQHALFSGLN